MPALIAADRAEAALRLAAAQEQVTATRLAAEAADQQAKLDL